MGGGKTLRDFALKPPIGVEADRTIFDLVDPGHSTDQGLLNFYGGVTAALKRAVELQPAAEGRSFQVVIGGERTGQSQRPMEARFGSASRGFRGRSGSVNGTSRVDSQMTVPVIHKYAFPDRFAFHAVTAPLKRPFMLQPVIEDRSVQVVIDGERTGQSQRLMEADFNR